MMEKVYMRKVEEVEEVELAEKAKRRQGKREEI